MSTDTGKITTVPGNGDHQPPGAQEAEPEVIELYKFSVFLPGYLGRRDSVGATRESHLIVLSDGKLLLLLLNGGRH